MYHNDYHFWGMHMIWWFVWIILLLWLFFAPYWGGRHRRSRESPMEILKRRFANGEINKEEYEERKRILEDGAEEGSLG